MEDRNAICEYIACVHTKMLFYVIYRKVMNLQVLQQHLDSPSLHTKIFLFDVRQDL